MAPPGTAASCVSSISRSIRLSVNNSSSQSGGKRLRPEAGRGRSNAPTPPGGAITPPPPKDPSNIQGKRGERKIKSGGRKDESSDEEDGEKWEEMKEKEEGGGV